MAVRLSAYATSLEASGIGRMLGSKFLCSTTGDANSSHSYSLPWHTECTYKQTHSSTQPMANMKS